MVFDVRYTVFDMFSNSWRVFLGCGILYGANPSAAVRFERVEEHV